MKSKLHLQGPLTVLFLLLSLGVASAQFSRPPIRTQVLFDPTTGQPIPPAPQWEDANWKDTNWNDPSIILTNVVFDGMPIGDVSSYLRDAFHNEFDIVLPKNWGAVVTGAQRAGGTQDWVSTPISLQLKNVTASETFNAMNLIFENDRVPLRWELKMNGTRRMALLRVLVDPPQQRDYAPPETTIRRVYFVGNLIGDEKNGGMAMEQIIKTITDVWTMADAPGGHIQFHKEAQLLVVGGTPSQIDFMEQTLKALGQKADQWRIEMARKGDKQTK